MLIDSRIQFLVFKIGYLKSICNFCLHCQMWGNFGNSSPCQNAHLLTNLWNFMLRFTISNAKSNSELNLSIFKWWCKNLESWETHRKGARNIQSRSQESLKNIKTCMNKMKLYKFGQRTTRRLWVEHKLENHLHYHQIKWRALIDQLGNAVKTLESAILY